MSTTSEPRPAPFTATARRAIAAGFAGVCAVLVLLPVLWPDAVTQGHASSIIEEEGLFEQFQWPWYLAAATLLFVAASRSRRDLRSCLRAAGVAACMLWIREFELDRDALGQRWYNPHHYLKDDTLPLLNRGVLFSFFLATISAGVHFLIIRRHSIFTWFRVRPWRKPVALVVCAFLCFALGLAMDKYRTIRKHLGIDLSNFYRTYAEEALELVGAMLVFLAALVVARQEMASNSARR